MEFQRTQLINEIRNANPNYINYITLFEDGNVKFIPDHGDYQYWTETGVSKFKYVSQYGSIDVNSGYCGEEAANDSRWVLELTEWVLGAILLYNEGHPLPILAENAMSRFRKSK